MAIAILSAAEVRQRVATGDRSYTVVDARHRDAFDRGHIPGALWMGWEQWCAPAPACPGSPLAQEGYWGELAEPSPAALAHRLAACGVHSDHPLVVYADGPRSRGREGRIAWMLLYLGATQVCLLDGGWGGWLAAGGPVDMAVPCPLPGHFTVAFQEQRRVCLSQLKEAYRAGALPLCIDTRGKAEFAGDQPDYLPRRGRLPSAVLLPFANLFDRSGAYIGRDRYRQGMPPAVQGASALVTYCEVGVRASLAALLHEIYTGQVVAVFDGSLMAWSLDPELPVESDHAANP